MPPPPIRTQRSTTPPRREASGRQTNAPSPKAGLIARQAATSILSLVLERRRLLDEAMTAAFQSEPASLLEPRDRAFVRMIVTTVLRRHGELAAVIRQFLEKPLPEKRGNLWPILLSASAQLLILDTPAHAAISLAVDECKADIGARRFDRLANAVLRRVSEQGRDSLKTLDPVSANVPVWLLERWTKTYGAETARAIAAASLAEPPLDLTIKAEPSVWAERLGGTLLPSESVRLNAMSGRIEDLAGYADGAWWVQDAAAALPAKLLGDVRDLNVLDLCAAPGGKTVQLAAAGAKVTALDASAHRMQRVTENLGRLQLTADCVVADATVWQPPIAFDAVLLDAPCTATGTIRRHPDILHIKNGGGLANLQSQQSRLLDSAARFVRPGGVLVYCTCSLEPEEGPDQIDGFLSRHTNFVKEAICAQDVAGQSEWISPRGELRTLPSHSAGPDVAGGLDGFFAARLRRRSAQEA